MDVTAPLTPVTDEEYEGQEDELEEDRIRIEAFIRDFAREMHDRAPLASSVTRSLNLYRRSDLSFTEFRALMYAAREKARHGSSVKNRMAYWFKILEQEIELVVETQ